MNNSKSFTQLVSEISSLNQEFSNEAKQAINTSLTLRNWCIGGYIHAYELNGLDRANYGDRLMSELAKSLKGIPNCNRRQLYDYLQFYSRYPQIVQTVSALLQSHSFQGLVDMRSKVPTVSAQSPIEAQTLVSKLSYSMFKLLVPIEDDTKRTFYEMEAVRGNWSVRELKRQINSLYYERSGLSINKKKLAEMIQTDAEQDSLQAVIRDPYVFEFLGLKSKEVMSESHLEDELLNKMEKFLLELGHGFCFEARQKRILIGNTHNFIDLVFYHRILKCHVLVELKLTGFNHENIGQLNTYLTWYHKNMMSEGDNPPIGILLCTDKDHAFVEYALAGMENSLFVSKYQLGLPKKEEMQKFIEEKLREVVNK